MTFSIAARSADGTTWGVAVASKFLAAGAVVPAARAGAGALATQSFVNLRYLPDGLALLADGEAWSTSALALALAESQRTVQRALAELEAVGRVRAIGRARAQRWLAPPLAGFTTILLLPSTLPDA